MSKAFFSGMVFSAPDPEQHEFSEHRSFGLRFRSLGFEDVGLRPFKAQFQALRV